MENKNKGEIEVKEEPEEESVVKQSSNSHIDEARNVKQEPEIHLYGFLREPRIILERINIEDYHQSVTKIKKSNGKKITKHQCGICFRYLSDKKNLIIHLGTHERDSYDCDQCSRTFDTKSQLVGHKRSHKERTITCDKCDQLFKSTRDLIKHQKSHEVKAPKVCAVCSRNFIQNGNLRRHMLTHQEDRRLFSCDLCESKFKDKSSLYRHIMSKHAQVEKKFFCDYCLKSFSHKDPLRTHIGSHMIECCKTCGKKVSRKSLNKHMKQVHGDNLKLKCPMCPKVLKSKTSLKDHIAIHEKKFKCKICDQKFSQNQHLTAHMKWHEDPNAFTCNLCNKNFQSRITMYNHRYACHQK